MKTPSLLPTLLFFTLFLHEYAAMPKNIPLTDRQTKTKSHEVITSLNANYRINDGFYPSLEISRHIVYIDEKDPDNAKLKYNSIGISLGYLKETNFSIGLRYSKQIFLHPHKSIIPVCSIIPHVFKYNLSYGVNIKPELMFVLLSPKKAVNLHISYGYDIPIVVEDRYGINRHEFSLKLAVRIYKLFFPKK